MSDPAAPIDIPNRALFKASEVCELLKLQPYVLRSWEAEFPDLGVSKSGSASRVYRQEDVQRVVRIRHLLLVEGLTLAGARRRLSEEAAPQATEIELRGDGERERLAHVKRGLRSLLELLDREGGPSEFRLAPPDSSGATGGHTLVTPTRSERGGAPLPSPRRKRSA